MKKIKFTIASIILSFTLVSASSIAGPTVKTPPQTATSADSSFSEWFYSLFDL
jgi:hypothetical protein